MLIMINLYSELVIPGEYSKTKVHNLKFSTQIPYYYTWIFVLFKAELIRSQRKFWEIIPKRG